MQSNPLENFTVRDSATMQEAIALIQKNASRCVLIVAADGKVIGAFSEGDVLRAILAGIDVHTPLRGLIKPSFRYLNTRDFKKARQLLIEGITLIPVIDDDFRLQSVITLHDILAGPAA